MAVRKMTVQTPTLADLRSTAPPTEGIKYAGSKLILLPYILHLAKKINARTVLDGFAGTTRVSQAFARSGYLVVCNDNAAWSEVFGTCYLKTTKPPEDFADLIDYLNALRPREGWFTQHYGGDPKSKTDPKRPWQVRNTRKLDAIREEIGRLSLEREEKCVALTSLILALD